METDQRRCDLDRFTANLPDSPANAVAVYPSFVAGIWAGDRLSASSQVPRPRRTGWNSARTLARASRIGLPTAQLRRLASFSVPCRTAITVGLHICRDLGVQPGHHAGFSIGGWQRITRLLRVFAGQTGTFNATMTALNGYTNSVTLNRVAGPSRSPNVRASSPVTMTLGVEDALHHKHEWPRGRLQLQHPVRGF